jgi:DNA-binding HxlR family transcriptional regulator
MVFTLGLSMTRTSLSHFNCSAARAFDVVGDKWSLLILRDAFYGVSTFNAFRSRLGMTGNILTTRLEHLVASGVLLKLQEKPEIERYRYVLSESGKELFAVLVAFTQWGDKWLSGSGNEPIKILDRLDLKPVQDISLLSASGKRLGAKDVVYEPGPGADAVTTKMFTTKD